MLAIKDMKMPKNCMMCPLCERMGSHLHCPVARTHIDIRCTEGRHPDCKLVEIEERKIEKLEKIEQIIDDCDLEAWEVLEKIKEVLEQE